MPMQRFGINPAVVGLYPEIFLFGLCRESRETLGGNGLEISVCSWVGVWN